MYLRDLRICNLRNLGDLRLSCSPGVNFIIGKNGQGKTNLIEAIYLLGAAKSFRTNRTQDLIGWDHQDASVFASVSQAVCDLDVGIAIESGVRRCFVNGKQLKSLADFVGKILCVSFSPTDLSLIKGSPGERRRFIDRVCVSRNPVLMRILLDYQRALKSKGILLRKGVKDRRMLETWNGILAQSAFKIIEERTATLAVIEEYTNTVHREFSAGDGAVNLILKSNLLRSKEDLTGESIYRQLEKNVDREIRQGCCLIGVHRDDILIELKGRDSRAFASQGQSRSLILSLKLAVIGLLEKERGDSPVVLLDDVDSELDAGRSRSFFDLILNEQRQVFITGTDLSVKHFDQGENHAVWVIENGAVSDL